MSKTRSARPAARPVYIYAEGHRRLIAVRNAPTLKQALLEYFKETLAPQGCSNPKTTGNTLTVADKQGNPKQWVALERLQQHTLY